MDEQILLRLQEWMLVFYALSIFFYFYDFLFHSRRANRAAFLFLLGVWLLQTILLTVYMIRLDRFPILTIYEGLYFYVWLLITFSLFVNRYLNIPFIVFFTNIFGFVLIVVFSAAPFRWSSNVLAEQFASESLFLHITLSLLAYASFSISSMFSVLYLFQYRILKRKIWKKRLWRLGDLNRLEKLSSIFDCFGIPLLLAGLVLGLQWAFIQIPDIALVDLKIVGSFFILFIYSWILYQRVNQRLNGIRFTLWNGAAFLMVLINFFLLGKFSNFHIWYI